LAGLAATSALQATPDICQLSAVEMARRLRAKDLSAREVLAAHLEQIERVNPKVNAIVTLVAEQAKERARLAKEAAVLTGDLAKIAQKLGNAQFLAKAKPEVIEEQRERQAETARALDKLKAAMAQIGAG